MNHHLEGAIPLTRLHGEPRASYQQWRETLVGESGLLLVEFKLESHWLERNTPQQLTAIYCVSDNALALAVTDQQLTVDRLAPQQQYALWVRRHQLLSYSPGSPIPLLPLCIKKPWGEEIWYTGVERRGVCHFGGEGATVPIPWLRAALPCEFAGATAKPLLLLKILAPSAVPVQGDLYFELHESKREAYVVTRIDPQAWPDGVGYIRYGFNPQQRAAYDSDEAFKEAYLAAVLAYREQRQKLDDMAEQGACVAAQDLLQERSLRQQMERFTQLRPLREGDVVQVPPLLPHALQHGVRTVEFQSPSYERKIISFAQKVLTQDEWDTEEAVPRMLLEPPPLAAPRVPAAPDEVAIEGLVGFPDFDVLRVRVQPGASWKFETRDSYRLLIVIDGALELCGALYGPEQALLLPQSWSGALAAPEAASGLVFLLAKPCS